jgi:hypothetical protein
MGVFGSLSLQPTVKDPTNPSIFAGFTGLKIFLNQPVTGRTGPDRFKNFGPVTTLVY